MIYVISGIIYMYAIVNCNCYGYSYFITVSEDHNASHQLNKIDSFSD